LKNEQQLEYLLKKDPEQIEKGLKIIANQVVTPKGKIDLLCVDEERVLTVVELKLDQDDDQLKQAINYYDWVFENMDWIRSTYPKFNISDDYRPKSRSSGKRFHRKRYYKCPIFY
jgi:RecB family endonuclease NucS